MARPVKEGLDYFPFPVDFFDDEIIDGISGEFGIKGEIVTVKLLCTVFKKGYFAVWNDLLQAQIAKKAQVSKDLVIQIVDRLVAWNYFDKVLYNSANVLTSADIQQTYLEATKRRKSQKPTLYWINVSNNPSSSVVNDDINTQSKVKETKGNKSKVNKIKLYKDKYSFLLDRTESPLAHYSQKTGKTIKPEQAIEIVDSYLDKGLTDYQITEVFDTAIAVALKKDKPSWNFIEGILKNWLNDGFTSIYDLQEKNGVTV